MINEPVQASSISLASILNDCSIDAITAIDAEWRIMAWNSAAEVFSGISKSAAMGKKLLETSPYLCEDTEIIKAIEGAFKGQKGFVPASTVFAHRQHIENHYIPVKDAAKNIIGVMNIQHDVAHRIKAEQQLSDLNQQLNRRVADLQKTTSELVSFTFISSTNIKEPIRHIYTSVEHLIKNEAKNLSDAGKASFRRIQSSLTRMNLLLDDLLGLAQINIIHKPEKDVVLNAVVQEVLTTLAKKIVEQNVTVNLHPLGTVKGHKEQLYKLFYQLLDNAIKFNHTLQPTITISCLEVWQNEAISLATATKYMQVRIKDNGIGFDQKDAEIIFNMFERLQHKGNFKGSGVGLAVARKIMDAHDGFITAESKLGEGTTINCFFPIDQQ